MKLTINNQTITLSKEEFLREEMYPNEFYLIESDGSRYKVDYLDVYPQYSFLLEENGRTTETCLAYDMSIEDSQVGIEINIFYDSKRVYKIYYFKETGEVKGKVIPWLDIKGGYENIRNIFFEM